MQKKSILVVDDDRHMHRMMSIIFENRGFTAEFAASGDRGLEILKGMDPNVIIVDINMPGISGFEFCRSVKRDERLKAIPIIMLSASPSEINKDLAMVAGATTLLGKPFRLDDLVERVMDLVN